MSWYRRYRLRMMEGRYIHMCMCPVPLLTEGLNYILAYIWLTILYLQFNCYTHHTVNQPLIVHLSLILKVTFAPISNGKWVLDETFWLNLSLIICISQNNVSFLSLCNREPSFRLSSVTALFISLLGLYSKVCPLEAFWSQHLMKCGTLRRLGHVLYQVTSFLFKCLLHTNSWLWSFWRFIQEFVVSRSPLIFRSPINYMKQIM